MRGTCITPALQGGGSEPAGSYAASQPIVAAAADSAGVAAAAPATEAAPVQKEEEVVVVVTQKAAAQRRLALKREQVLLQQLLEPFDPAWELMQQRAAAALRQLPPGFTPRCLMLRPETLDWDLERAFSSTEPYERVSYWVRSAELAALKVAVMDALEGGRGGSGACGGGNGDSSGSSSRTDGGGKSSSSGGISQPDTAAGGTSWVSSHDVLCGQLWLAVAGLPSRKGLPHGLTVMVDMRSRLPLPLPSNTSGNLVWAGTAGPALVDGMSLAQAAAHVREGMNR